MSEKALVPVDQRQVDFYGDQIAAALADDGEVYIPLRPLCDFLGLDWSAQRQRLLRDPVLSDVAMSVVITTTDMDPTSRRPRASAMLALPLDYLNGWLFGVSAGRVKPELRERVIRYQRECYQVLARAFGERPQPSAATSTLIQVREMGRAIMQLAEEQIEFERRLASTEGRLDKAATVVGDLAKRVSSLEQQVSPGNPVTEDQAMQISQAVKSVALAMPDKNFGAVYGELYRKFGVTSYKLLPARRFEEAMRFLTEWHASLVGSEPF
jgi:hypothetical protein